MTRTYVLRNNENSKEHMFKCWEPDRKEKITNTMKLTRNNLNKFCLKNQDARLIEDVGFSHSGQYLTYHDVEITLQATQRYGTEPTKRRQNEAPYHALP